MKLYRENALDSEKITQYKNLAKLRGYTITTTTKDSKGKQIKKVEGDINSFINNYLPALAEQVRLTTKQKIKCHLNYHQKFLELLGQEQC